MTEAPDAHHRHPRNRGPAELDARQFEHRFFRNDHVGGRRHHRRDARRQAGLRLRLQFHRALCLRRADAGALHSARAQGRSEIAAQRGRRQFRAGKNPRRDDAERKIRRPQRALGRHRHHRGRGVGRGRQDRGKAAASAACRALQRRQNRRQGFLLCRRRLVCAGKNHQGFARTRCSAISMPATPW